MSLRVLLASHSATLTAGAERSLLQIALYLGQRGADVTVAVPGDEGLAKALGANGIETAVLAYDWGRPHKGVGGTDLSLSAPHDITAYLRATRPDVVMTNTLVIPWFGFAANHLGIPHAWFIREDLSSDPGFAYPDVERTLGLIRASADGVFVPSAYMRDLYRRLLDRPDVRLVYPTFDPTIAEWADRRQASTGRRIVVCATITPHKNQMEALLATSILREQGREFELTLIGSVASQAYRRQLDDFVSDHGLESIVSFAPPTDDPYAVLATHDICVVPSTNEPSSRVMIEAMLVGTAVVASAVGGNVEKAGGDGRAAVLYPLGHPDVLAERLALLMDDGQSLREQAARGHAFAVAMYVQQDQLAPLLAGLEEIAQLPRRPPGPWIVDDLIERSVEYAQLRSEMVSTQDELPEPAADDVTKPAERTSGTAALANNQPWSARRLNFLASALGATDYLEIGVAEGHTFAMVAVAHKTGVDPEPSLDPALDDATRSRVVRSTSDDFFAALSPATTFDLVYIDGLHTFEQTYRDLCNVLLHTHLRSAILVDDTVPVDVYSAIPDKPRAIRLRSRDRNAIEAWMGDVYKVVLAVHDFHFALNYQTIVGSGNPQTLIWRSKAFVRSPSLSSFEALSRFTYFDLLDHAELLRKEQESEALKLCIDELVLARRQPDPAGKSTDGRLIHNLVAERDTLNRQLDAQQRLIASYATSRSWRLTEPLRSAGRMARRLGTGR